MNKVLHLVILTLSVAFVSCNNSSNEKPNENDSADATKRATFTEENVTYSADTTSMNGYVVYSDSFQGKRPAVLVVHEWWGLTDYPKTRAKQLAQLGYIAMAVDMFGNGKTAANPGEAMQLAGPFYQNPQMIKTRMDAALAKLKSYPQTDTGKIAAIGYCYGGFVVLNAAKLGSDLDGVVSFHGNLAGVAPDKNKMKAQVLVCHGGADKFVSDEEIARFKKQMDSVGATYTFKTYPDSKHAFTNPEATENGKKFTLDIAYNEEADRNSWNDMKEFFARIFR